MTEALEGVPGSDLFTDSGSFLGPHRHCPVAALFLGAAMDYGLLIRALEKHARMAQAAVDFAREKQRGQLFAEAMYVLEEALQALDHVRQEQAEKRVK